MSRPHRVCWFVGGLTWALLASGCAVGHPGSARAATSSTPSASASPAGPHVPPGGGTVELTAYSSNDGPTSVVVVTGAVGDYGTATATDAEGRENQTDRSGLRLDLSHGSFRLDVAELRSRLTESFTTFPANASTCSGTVSVTGPGTIVDGSGTGSYRGIAGQLQLTVVINEVDAKTPAPCDASTPFVAQTVFLMGSGTVTGT